MSLKKAAVSVFLAAAVIIPGVSTAQATGWWCNPQFSSWWGNTSCDVNYGGAGLAVYVVVPGQGLYGVPLRAPADFTVSVSGSNPNPSTFRGSNTGVPVLLGSGTYNVTITGDSYGYTPTFSQGCTGTLAAGQNALCTISMSPSSSYYPYPTPYQGSYYNTPITCTPAYQTVAAGQTARFEAVGGYGPYTWTTAERTYLNVGAVLSVALQHTGTQTVIVQSASGSASCTVNVVSTGGAIVYPTTLGVPLTTYSYNSYNAAPAYNYTATPYASTYIPRLANTGFEPITSAQIAFAVVGLIGFALVAAPYVRKTLASAGI